jgi:hypothetical protein
MQSQPSGSDKPVFSPVLTALMDDVLAGRSPNVGRFCGNCYAPLGRNTERCQYCGSEASAVAPLRRLPREVFAVYRAQRAREGWVVRGIAYGGLLAGIILGLLPIAFYDVHPWTAIALFAIIIFFYLLAANLANSLGDALGYAWGQSAARKRLQALAEAQAEEVAGS